MKVKFVPQNVEFEIQPGQSVMHVAQDHDIYVKSVCKGVPSCAECRVRIIDGEHNVLPPGSEELSLIGTGHFIDRRRLSCQLKCFGDITVDMSEQIAKQQGLIGGQKKKKLAVKDDRIEDAQAKRADRPDDDVSSDDAADDTSGDATAEAVADDRAGDGAEVPALVAKSGPVPREKSKPSVGGPKPNKITLPRDVKSSLAASGAQPDNDNDDDEGDEQDEPGDEARAPGANGDRPRGRRRRRRGGRGGQGGSPSAGGPASGPASGPSSRPSGNRGGGGGSSGGGGNSGGSRGGAR